MANYVYNSASSGEKYNAKCLNVSDDSEWTPSAAEYPEDGTIDLSGGTSGRYLDTQWIAPQDTEWTMTGIYNVVMGVSYDMYSIHYKGNQTCDIYLGSNTEDLVLSESDKDYTPPTGNWIIEEEPPAIITPPSTSTYTIFISPESEIPNDAMPSGVTINSFWDHTDTTTVFSLVDGDNTPTPITIQNKIAWNALTTSPTAGGNTGPMYDYQIAKGWRVYGMNADVDIDLEAGTYNIEVYGSASQSGYADYTLNGETLSLDQTMSTYTPTLVTFSNIVSAGGILTLNTAINAGSDRAFLSGINIYKVG